MSQGNPLYNYYKLIKTLKGNNPSHLPIKDTNHWVDDEVSL
jgi:hypothetical protein